MFSFWPGLNRLVWYVRWYNLAMDQRLVQLLDLLDRSDRGTVGTSVRVPLALRDAAVLAAEMGLADSTTDLTVRGLRDQLEAVVQRAVLDVHYRDHPHVRPDLAEIALVAAEMEGNPLAERPELIRRAASEITRLSENPTPDDVLLYAAGLAAAA
jgi:hypothetical protein